MNATAKQILLLGSYGRGNIGDDAFLAAAVKHFPEDAKIYLNSSDDELLPKIAAGRVHTLSTTNSSDFRQKIKAFRDVKHIVYCGGDLWVELHGNAYPRASLYKMLGMNLVARLSGKRVYYLGCGAGDLKGYSLLLARMSARLANAVVLREPRSAKLLSLRRSVVLPDLITSLGWPIKTRERYATGKPFTIGISILYHLPNPERTFPQLLETLHDFVAGLPTDQFRVVLFPMLVSPADPKDDLWASRQLQLALEDVADVTISPARELDDVLKELDDIDLMIGARLHANILALMSGVPCLGIAYRPKVSSFFAMNKLKDYCIDLARLTAKDLGELFWIMRDSYPHVLEQFMTARDQNIRQGAAYQTFIQRHF